MLHNTTTRATLADVLRQGLRSYMQRYGTPVADVQDALRDILTCRTEVLGSHTYRCDACGHDVRLNNSCRNRHCPLCERMRQAQWVEERSKEILPVQYFHIVFTLPDLCIPITQKQPVCVYKTLFDAVSKTMLTLAADKKWLGAKIGFIAVLHTWGQTLVSHPHLHLIVPGGGIRTDKDEWKNTSPDFVIPCKVLAAMFKGKFMAALKKKCAADLTPELISRLYEKDWVVYAKGSFTSPAAVIKYLGRYTHRIAISNKRIQSVSDETVRFTYKDYADKNAIKTMSLPIVEFIRRFVGHVLPKGLVRIRSFGLLANRQKTNCLELCRRLLNVRCEEGDNKKLPWYELFKKLSGFDPRLCPSCRKGMLKLFDVVEPPGRPPAIEMLCMA